MKDQVVMSPNNAELAVAIPLFRRLETEPYFAAPNDCGIRITCMEELPTAYLIDCGAFCSVMSAEWVEENLIFLGGL